MGLTFVRAETVLVADRGVVGGDCAPEGEPATVYFNNERNLGLDTFLRDAGFDVHLGRYNGAQVQGAGFRVYHGAHFFFVFTLVMSLKYEPASKPLHICAHRLRSTTPNPESHTVHPQFDFCTLRV